MIGKCAAGLGPRAGEAIWPRGAAEARPRRTVESRVRQTVEGGGTRRERIAAKQIELAEGGNVRAIHKVFNRVIGKAPQKFRFGPELNPDDGQEGITPEEEVEVARQVDEMLGIKHDDHDRGGG